MNAQSVPCPSCGQAAEGKFCSHCGASIGSTQRWNAQTIAPWAALGLAALALFVPIVALIARPDRSPVAMPFAPALPPVAAGPVAGTPPDLSSLSPREAADRLFNRIMTAAERGDRDEAMRFVPMALQAYDNLGTLDNDALYHVALIHLTAGDVAQARRDIDSLRQRVPGHLLASMLERQIAEQGGDRKRAAQAHAKFLAAYDAEMAAARPEYQDHQRTIERFREAALAAKAAKK